MELIPRVSAEIIKDERRYEFTFPNGAPAQDTLQALVDIHKQILELAKNNENKDGETCAGDCDKEACSEHGDKEK